MPHARSIYSVRVKSADGAGHELLALRHGKNLVRFDQLDPTDQATVNGSIDYSYIFGHKGVSELPSDDAIQALGTALKARPYPFGESDVPAGYTYLGQFIFHDITWLRPGGKNKTTPALDLNSVLPGVKPLDTPELCAADGLLKIGTTFEIPLNEDVPRILELYHKDRFKPLIADLRNDDFLPLSQSHLLLLKFYNAAARFRGYRGEHRDDLWWEELRSVWVKHFQAVVLFDYLPRIIDSQTYWDVMHNGRCLIRTSDSAPDDPAWLPIEFAGAVGRFGHSMIRESYRPWNRRLSLTNVTVDNFMDLSYANSGDKLEDGFHFSWVSNWLSMFDFSNTGYSGPAGPPIKSARIDTYLAPQLSKLRGCLLEEDICSESNSGLLPFDLATFTMSRGRELGIASAQQAIEFLNKRLCRQITELSPAQLFPEQEGLHHVARAHPALGESTPLWYYVLREAEVLGNGSRLGPLGGRIVMETLHAAIRASKDSILGTEWQTEFPPIGKAVFSMPNLILFSTNPNPLDF